ncbi:MAG TPA: hypothetical protein VK928_09995, partial [Longimicrobiales bacterium]|nr:hypothetical protein [Longimicrobiales bacterium]
MRTLTLCVLLISLSIAGPAAAQVPADTVRQDSVRRVPVGTLMLGAAAGSAIGLVAGFSIGEGLGWGGGDDPGLASALLFSGIGSAVGTAAGVQLFSAGRVPFGTTWGVSVITILAGIGGAVAFNRVTDGRYDVGGVIIGYSLGQGITAGLITSALQAPP